MNSKVMYQANKAICVYCEAKLITNYISNSLVGLSWPLYICGQVSRSCRVQYKLIYHGGLHRSFLIGIGYTSTSIIYMGLNLNIYPGYHRHGPR
jgi:hypothetical protein